jgi:hypothetical protein
MVAVKELSWEDISAPDFGTAPRAAFRQAVAEVAAKAKVTLPECHGRVDAAVKLVLAGDVELLDEGKARIASQANGQTTYLVCNGTCECKDFAHAPSSWCKHRIAAGLMTRAVALADALLHQTLPLAAVPGPAPAFPLVGAAAGPAPAPAPAQLPEAPASVNCHITIGGRQVQLTLRDTDETRLLQRLAAVLACYPVPQAPAPAAPAQPTPAATPDGWCAVHQVAMGKQSNARGSWFSHKTAEGSWCKGK